jgi:hypothetical protein
MSGTRQASGLGAIPSIVGLTYYAAQEIIGPLPQGLDAAGVVMLIALGLAIGFGMLVILRGARDL